VDDCGASEWGIVAINEGVSWSLVYCDEAEIGEEERSPEN